VPAVWRHRVFFSCHISSIPAAGSLPTAAGPADRTQQQRDSATCDGIKLEQKAVSSALQQEIFGEAVA